MAYQTLAKEVPTRDPTEAIHVRQEWEHAPPTQRRPDAFLRRAKRNLLRQWVTHFLRDDGHYLVADIKGRVVVFKAREETPLPR